MSTALKAKGKIRMHTSKEFRHGFAGSLIAPPFHNQAAHKQTVSNSKQALPRLYFSCRGAFRTELLKIFVKIYVSVRDREESPGISPGGSLLSAPFQHLLHFMSNAFIVFEMEIKTSIWFFLKKLFLSSRL